MHIIKHAQNTEWWITAATLTKRGWQPTPRHAHGGRHANPNTRNGRKILSRVYGK